MSPRKPSSIHVSPSHPLKTNEGHQRHRLRFRQFSELLGTSTEGRPLKVMKVGLGGRGHRKPAIWIDGGTTRGQRVFYTEENTTNCLS